MLIYILFLSVCIYLSIQDIRKKVVPVWLLLVLVIIAVVGEYMTSGAISRHALLGVCPGIFMIISGKVTGQIGVGDGLLVLAIGILIGLYMSLYMIMFAFLMALCFFGFIRFYRRAQSKTIPFIPFISVSFFIVLLLK